MVSLDPTVAREQAGRRHAVVAASAGLAVGLAHPTFAMTEQPRTISRRRIATVAGKVDDECRGAIRRWLNDFLYD